MQCSPGEPILFRMNGGGQIYSFLAGVRWLLTHISGFPQACGCRCLPLVRTPFAVSNWSPGWPTPHIYRAHSPLPSLPHTRLLLPHLRGFTCTRLVTLVGMSEFPKRRADWIHRGQCRLSIILAGNFLVLGGPEHGLEGESISSWESLHGRRERNCSPKHRQPAPKAHCLSTREPQVGAGQEYESSGFLSRFAQPLMSPHP